MLIKRQIVLSTWRNRTLKGVWFRNKTRWLSELSLPEPLRSPISPCDFLCAYFPYHNRPWLFHTRNVVCSRGKTSCPLSPFPSSIWWSLLPDQLGPHGTSLWAGPWSPRAVLPLPKPVFWGENMRVAPTWFDALQTHDSKSALHAGGLHLKCRRSSGCCTLAVPSPRALCRSPSLLFTPAAICCSV